MDKPRFEPAMTVNQDGHSLEIHASGKPCAGTLSAQVDFSRGLTVEAWIDADVSRPEALQSIVSKWAPPQQMGEFAGSDAGQTDGLRSEGYFGAVFDGRYVYFAPQHYEDLNAHGVVLRYDTHAPFDTSDSYEAYNAGTTGGLVTRGYYGAAFDGRYVHFVPRQTAAGYHSRALRFDTRSDFKAPSAWDAHDVGETHSQQGVAFDGRYLYYSPGYAGDPRKEDTDSARVIRCDTTADFHSDATWETFDAAQLSDHPIGCFDGAGFDGRHIYFAPLQHGVVIRYDACEDFDLSDSWQVFDARTVGMGMCVGTVFDGRYVYYVAYGHSNIVRFDTEGQFDNLDCWEARDVDNTSGLRTNGFDGGFFDGTYVYFVPFVGEPITTRPDGRPGYTFHSNLLRYDPKQPFQDPQSWQAADGSGADGLHTVGYNGGAFDGRFFYMAPWRDGSGDGGMHGRILRYDTLGTNGSFDLRFCDYGHNGGLCAAVPGPSFLVNTDRGALSVAAHQTLSPGAHHLAGTYDGSRVRLLVNGQVVAERAGSGSICRSDADIVVGNAVTDVGRFAGRIDKVRITPGPLPGGSIGAIGRATASGP